MNKFEQKTDTLNNPEKTLELDNSVSALQEEISKIDESKLNPEQKTSFNSIKDRIKKVSSKFAKVVGWVSIVGSTLVIANNERTHLSLEVIKQNDTTEIYHHPDERTTHMLNILGGKEKFTEDDVRADLDNLWEYASKVKNVSTDKKITEMSIDEIDDFLFKNQDKFKDSTHNVKKFEKGEYRKEIDRKLKYLNKVDTSEFSSKSKIYELVWQLERECGNPKIRFTSENIGFTPISDIKGAKHYDPVNNIVYISPYDLIARSGNHSELIDEMSHAKQFSEHPIATSFQWMKDIIGVVSNSNFKVDNLTKEYQSLYSKPGTVEHEAHKVIEPYLKEKYNFFIKNKK